MKKSTTVSDEAVSAIQKLRDAIHDVDRIAKTELLPLFLGELLQTGAVTSAQITYMGIRDNHKIHVVARIPWDSEDSWDKMILTEARLNAELCDKIHPYRFSLDVDWEEDFDK